MKPFDIEHLEHMAARFNPLPLQDNFLNMRYEWQKVTNSVEWPYYRFFWHLAKMLQPRLIVELGGWQGTAAAHFADGHRIARVMTVDHHTDPGDEINRQKMLEACEVFSNIIYLERGNHALGDALSVRPRIKHAGKIDILFIDSWHTYENAMLDWEYYEPLLNSPALVICDDIQDGEIAGAPISGMLRFWSELPEPKFLNGNLHPGTMMGFLKV
jgi:predicted O-methyltransferase YrrM